MHSVVCRRHAPRSERPRARARRRLGAALVLLVVVAAAGAAPAQVRVVGVKQAPPFASRAQDGTWTGISVELWDAVAQELGVEYRLREYELAPLLDAVADGSVALGLGAITVTAERERRLDFSHPLYSSGLGVAVAARGSGWRSALSRLFSSAFVRALSALVVAVLAVGAIVWLLERRRNPEQFGGGAAQGVGSGFWWAAVTMTTVGYGDKAPRTFAGRLVALVWMFFSIVTISGFTAAIASALTVSQLEAAVREPGDLARVRVGSIADTTSTRYLERHGLRHARYADAADALEALARGDLDAVVYDAPILRHQVQASWRGALRVLPFTLERQDYAIPLPPRSALREPLNRALLDRIADPAWEQVLRRHLGDEGGL